jgi:hypothetical protein
MKAAASSADTILPRKAAFWIRDSLIGFSRRERIKNRATVENNDALHAVDTTETAEKQRTIIAPTHPGGKPASGCGINHVPTETPGFHQNAGKSRQGQ